MPNFFQKHSKLLLSLLVIFVLFVWYSARQGSSMNFTVSDTGSSYAEQGIAAPMMMKDGLFDEAASAPDSDYKRINTSVNGATDDLERKVITTGSFTIEVEAPETTATELQTYVGTIGGFLDNLNISEYTTNKKQAHLTLRVPADKFVEASAKLRTYGYVKSENVNSRDVSSEYYDNDEHIKNLELEEASVRGFFNQATKVEDILTIHKELASLREQIESLKGSQKNLDRQISYSTIEVSLLPDIEINPISDEEWNVVKIFKQNLNGLVSNLQGLAEFAIFVVMQAVIWVPLLLIAYYVWKVIKKWRNKGGVKR